MKTHDEDTDERTTSEDDEDDDHNRLDVGTEQTTERKKIRSCSSVSSAAAAGALSASWDLFQAWLHWPVPHRLVAGAPPPPPGVGGAADGTKTWLAGQTFLWTADVMDCCTGVQTRRSWRRGTPNSCSVVQRTQKNTTPVQKQTTLFWKRRHVLSNPAGTLWYISFWNSRCCGGVVQCGRQT